MQKRLLFKIGYVCKIPWGGGEGYDHLADSLVMKLLGLIGVLSGTSMLHEGHRQSRWGFQTRFKHGNERKLSMKYSSVFRDNRCPPPLKPVYGGNFSHEAVSLKIRSRSPKSNKLLILSDLYRLANLVTFHLVVHEIICRPTSSWDMMHTSTFWIKFGSLSLAVTLKIRSWSPKPNQLFIMS